MSDNVQVSDVICNLCNRTKSGDITWRDTGVRARWDATYEGVYIVVDKWDISWTVKFFEGETQLPFKVTKRQARRLGRLVKCQFEDAAKPARIKQLEAEQAREAAKAAAQAATLAKLAR